MPASRPALAPIKTEYRLNFLSEEQLDQFQEATLNVLENVGVQFPSERALEIFNQHGAKVDQDSQSVKIPRELVFKALATVPL